MKQYLILLILIIFTGCATPKNPQAWMEMEKNACLPTAIAFREGLRKYNVWSEVVVYSYFDKDKNKIYGHAVVAYMYPIGKNQLWTYDYLGSYRTRAYKNDPYKISEEAEKLRGRIRTIETAEFLK
jgi:hypothetical protein